MGSILLLPCLGCFASVCDEPAAEEQRVDPNGAPAWSAELDARPDHPASSVPQLPDALDVYGRLVPQEGERLRGILVCLFEVSSGNQWDRPGLRGLHTLPDVTLHVTLPDGRRESLTGPEETTSFHASIPGVTLDRGDEIALSAVDRDVIVHDAMGSATVEHTGRLPLRVTGPHWVVECRLAPQPWAEERARPLLAAADDQVTRARADVHANDDNYADGPDGALEPARRAVLDVAAVLGWMDERVAAEVSALAAIETRFRQEVAVVVRRLGASAPPMRQPAALGPLLPEVRVADLSCNPDDPTDCDLSVGVTYELAEGQEASAPEAVMIHADGRVQPLPYTGSSRDEERGYSRQITRSGEVTQRYQIRGDVGPYVRLSHDGAHALMRIER